MEFPNTLKENQFDIQIDAEMTGDRESKYEVKQLQNFDDERFLQSDDVYSAFFVDGWHI